MHVMTDTSLPGTVDLADLTGPGVDLSVFDVDAPPLALLSRIVRRIATDRQPTVWADLSADLDLADVIAHAATRQDLDPAEVARTFRQDLGAEPVDADAITRADLAAAAVALQSGKGQAGALAALGCRA